MTKKEARMTYGGKLRGEITSLLLLALTLLFGLTLSAEAAEYVKAGIDLGVSYVIPSSFPFMIISELYTVYGKPENIRALRYSFSRLLGVPEGGLAPFICGNIGGFPIGAKMVADSYSAGALSKDSAQRLAALSNNPSCAFIVGGVGLGIYGDAGVGFLLLASVYASTIICGLLTKTNDANNHFTANNTRQRYNFVSSVKSAAISSVNIIAFISVFSVIIGILKKRVKYEPLLYGILAFSEVTNAVTSFAELRLSYPCLALALSAFSLGFGGICVGMQSSVFTSACGLKMKKYYLIKLLMGTVAAAACTLLYVLI